MEQNEGEREREREVFSSRFSISLWYQTKHLANNEIIFDLLLQYETKCSCWWWWSWWWYTAINEWNLAYVQLSTHGWELVCEWERERESSWKIEPSTIQCCIHSIFFSFLANFRTYITHTLTHNRAGSMIVFHSLSCCYLLKKEKTKSTHNYPNYIIDAQRCCWEWINQNIPS